MSAEIQFGDMFSREPESSLRPDENLYFAVIPCGKVDPEELAIFVDWDVLQEMELHAQSNTNVELGGVLMGRQMKDRQGRPFVLVEDSIRAQHYQATKGSFKFTHETWQQITRDRDRMPRQMQMVGWYHTHPGWGVFLSGMDDFICKNFFSQPLDVALVIDPCQNDRGWFHWTAEGETKRCSAFYIMAHRHRESELVDFVTFAEERETMSAGVRPTRSASNSGTTVQLIEREPRTDWVVIGMLTMQFMALLLFGWRGLAPTSQTQTELSTQASWAEMTERIDKLEMRNQVLTETLKSVAADPANLQLIANKLADAEFENRRLSEAVTSHISRIESLGKAMTETQAVSDRVAKENESLRTRIGVLELTQSSGESTESSWVLDNQFPWWQKYGLLLGIAGLAVALCSIVGAIWWSRSGEKHKIS